MHTHGRFSRQFGRYVFNGAEEVAFAHLICNLPPVGSLTQHPCFSNWVVTRTTCSAEHLVHFHDRKWSAHSIIPAFDVSNQDTSCWKVHSCCKCWCGTQGEQKPILERGFNALSLAMRQPCMVESNASTNALGEQFTHTCLCTTLERFSDVFEFEQTFWLFLRKPFFNTLREFFCLRLSTATRSNKDQYLPTLFNRVLDNNPCWVA